MNASELSEQIARHVEAGEWPQAMSALVEAWNESAEFGVVRMAGPFDVWVRFKTTGYPFRMRREWDAAKTDEATLAIVLPRVVEWNIKDADGKAVPVDLSRGAALLDNVEEPIVVWLIQRFFIFWRRDLVTLRPN